jgi:DNA primase
MRNDIPISTVIADILEIPSKTTEGYFRFLCPLCNEFNTATNPKTNLARCFGCRRNFNPIDMVMVVKRMNFKEAVEYLMDTVR